MGSEHREANALMAKLRRDILRFIEAAVVGLTFVQSVRYLYATLYARASSADLVGRVPAGRTLEGIPGVVEMATVQQELVLVGVLLLLPLLALVIGRWRISLPFAVLLIALGRSVALQTADFTVPAAALAVGACLLYVVLTIRIRPDSFPVMMLMGVAGDQLIRAADDTWDRTWQGGYTLDLGRTIALDMEMAVGLVALGLIAVASLLWYLERRHDLALRAAEGYAPPLSGSMNVWGGLAFGAILFLEFTLLGLPNTVARAADADYAGLVPWLLAATLLPLVPEVREQALRFAGMFDGAWRGWLWALLLGLLIVTGRRYDGVIAAIALVVAQFMVGLSLWWVYTKGISRRHFGGITILFGVVSFGILAIGDYFTYDYAYVRDLRPPYESVDEYLRSFREMGLPLALVAVLLVSIPMILARRHIPWRGGPALHTLGGLILVLAVSVGGANLAAGHVVQRPLNPNCLRIMSLNIHGGYSQFFDPNLDRVARLIELNGADVVLLQEVDTGRMASFGVDQVLWLARKVGMEATFYPQNEALQGLAVLSRVPIENFQGLKLPSDGNQAAVMRVELDPERLVADPLADKIGPLTIYNAWLGFRVAERDGQPIPEGEQDQNRQLRLMLNRIAGQHAQRWDEDRIAMGGTFNFGTDSPLYDSLRVDNAGIKDPHAGLRASDAMTVFLVDGTAARYDYLWTFNLPLVGADVDQSAEAANTSDHRPVIVAIKRRGPLEPGEAELICTP